MEMETNASQQKNYQIAKKLQRKQEKTQHEEFVI
jgi:hypothetical protein